MSTEYDRLRSEFLRLLTQDGPTQDRRRKDYNQAIFIPMDDSMFPGHAVFTGTSLDMVMDKFDIVVGRLAKEKR